MTSYLWASAPPCSEFEFLVKAHEVQAYKKTDGTVVSGSSRIEHCREFFIGTKEWAKSFNNGSLNAWPYSEKFKIWSKGEKEIILKIISNWPDIFQKWKGAEIFRAVKSKFPNNPAASLPISNSIILYDDFFKQSNKGAILAHELAHIYILRLSPIKLKTILTTSGWDFNQSKPKWTGNVKPLKDDSPNSPSEDLANNIEDYLYSPQEIKQSRPKVHALLRELLGNEFKLKDQK